MQKGGFTLYLKVKGCVVQSLSHVRLFVTPWTAARQASLSFDFEVQGEAPFLH